MEEPDEDDGHEFERRTARALRTVLLSLVAGDEFKDDADRRSLELYLEFFLPAFIQEVHSESWRKEEFDGFYFEVARKLDALEAEFIGWVILISDQTLTPIHLQLGVAAEKDEIDWMILKVGERLPDSGTMVRLPYNSSLKWRHRHNVSNRLHLIDWYFHVGFGERGSNR